MNSTGRNGEKTGYLGILLLVVGLTAFSHSMKELTEIHQLALDASRLVAQWSGNIAPAETPQTVVKLESCQTKQSTPVVELPWLAEKSEPSAVAPGRPEPPRKPAVRHAPIKPSEGQIAKLKKLRRVHIDSDAFEVRISGDDQSEGSDEPIAAELPLTMFKAKNRKHGAIRINPRDREILLKTLNRSINLRIAG